ncbi:hypothetical protein COV88_03180 [Candidatus Saccharibacteria bacterium CG11_big_fil_rev_8_21_14_0_20_41_19]|nr:hypothetical protein [Candidatus Saccharibacteria bacterium]OIP85567.1 MAG: hypothetical protein AUK57_03640 [Candidatus Saccharibacteria bacterium CG2_30_41_52]PIQ70730.1 MAG: hypothetical protein COV88_03180 [Candidatus Saccharibacteria bacterium CG11_big_fil_rev_8_21_14_0_20_41_19]PIZ59311.1 MAG: hypothetical protein COY18_03900 [Candidatus Saccharibacteria bacterium CG_4_10_14_0_2_um_filter_41_11]PJC29823.1 MAG: hypothetical protein CO052_01435 [Candidatus Saccharibacteria bacterium CG_4
MSPNKNVNSLNYSNEKTDAKSEKGFTKTQKLIASVALGAAMFIGGLSLVKEEQQFPDGYQNIPKPEMYLQATNSVIPGEASVEQEPVAELKGPYVEASHSVLVPADTTEQAPTVARVTEPNYTESEQAAIAAPAK